ncbi:MAG: Hsp70 family protein, partial [Flavobacteriales bacterium]|nr:Hsp70 family protein [Flavobacteriales bacterium]
EEIEKMKQEAEANADADNKAKETADKINGADGMIFQTEKQLKEFGEKLSDDKKAPIEESLVELKAAHESKDLAAIDTAMEKINTAWTAASEEMYKASQEEGAAPQGDQGEAVTDDVTDVEFEEVKEEEVKEEK